MSFARRNRPQAWKRVESLEDQLVPLRIKYKQAADQLEGLATEITAILFEIWRAARHPDVAADFYIEIAKMPGKSLFAKLCTFYLNYTKEEFHSNGTLQRKHTEMTGVLEFLEMTWPKDRDVTQRDVIAFINDRGGITRIYMAYLSRKAKEKRDADDALLLAEQQRKALEEEAIQNRLEVEALKHGMTVEQYLADQSQKTEKQKEQDFLAAIQVVMQELVESGTQVTAPKGDGTFYFLRKRKLYKINQSDAYDMLATKAKLIRPKGV
jgi:hypothetical protein